MNPEAVLDAAVASLRARPPAGVDRGYLEGFVVRHRAALLGAVRGALEARRGYTPRLAAALRELSGVLEEHGFAATQSAVIAFYLYQEGAPLYQVFPWLDEHPGVDDPEWIFRGDVGALVALVREDLDLALTEFCPEDELGTCRRHITELLPVIREVATAAGLTPPDLVVTDEGLMER
ncbi:MAG: hypothetical protein ABIO70_25745 [Pseudomonadota bacterium]